MRNKYTIPTFSFIICALFALSVVAVPVNARENDNENKPTSLKDIRKYKDQSDCVAKIKGDDISNLRSKTNKVVDAASNFLDNKVTKKINEANENKLPNDHRNILLENIKASNDKLAVIKSGAAEVTDAKVLKENMCVGIYEIVLFNVRQTNYVLTIDRVANVNNAFINVFESSPQTEKAMNNSKLKDDLLSRWQASKDLIAESKKFTDAAIQPVLNAKNISDLDNLALKPNSTQMVVSLKAAYRKIVEIQALVPVDRYFGLDEGLAVQSIELKNANDEVITAESGGRNARIAVVTVKVEGTDTPYRIQVTRDSNDAKWTGAKNLDGNDNSSKPNANSSGDRDNDGNNEPNSEEDAQR